MGDSHHELVEIDGQEFAEGVGCPNCGEEWDDLMGRPALRHVGHNTKSGELYSCGCCHQRVTEAEIETGKLTPQLVEEGYFDDE